MNDTRDALILVLVAAMGQASAVLPAHAQSTITDGCMQDVAGFGLNCATNDIVFGMVTYTVIDPCESPGDTATVDMSVQLENTAATRYDIGVWVAVDGGNALTGECSVSYVPVPPGFDLDAQSGDTCGDMTSGQVLSALIGPTSLACVDADGDGFLNVTGCASFSNQIGAICTHPLETAPASPLKCGCQPLVFAPPIPVQLIDVSNDNDASGDGTFSDTETMTTVTADVTYRVTLSNPTTTAVEILDIVDDTYSLVGSSCQSLIGYTLAGGGSVSCTFTETITAAASPVIDRVTVTVRPPIGTVAGCDSSGECMDSASDISTVLSVDADGDGTADPFDCAPLDPGAFAVPGEVTGDAFGADEQTFSWSSAAPWSGSDTFYDVMRGALGQLPVGSGAAEICIVSGHAGLSFPDGSIPSAHSGFYYLVRGRNVCGTGTYGSTTSGSERSSSACP